jgi:hypothetical protein
VNEVELNIRMQDQVYRERYEMAETAARSIEQCLYAVANGFDPDPTEFNWASVTEYLNRH